MRQVTLVALYGPKPDGLRDLIKEIQKIIGNHPGINFQPYDIMQVHSTVVGLERVIGSAMLNSNFAKWRGRSGKMDFDGFLNYLRQAAPLPFKVQLAGYDSRDYPFRSRGERPYERSFSVQGDKAVLMGWPLCGDPYVSIPQGSVSAGCRIQTIPMLLDEIRRHCQCYGALHSYHRQLTDVDNDFYFRIGFVDAAVLTQNVKQQLQTKIQKHLSDRTPVVFEVALKDLFVVSYNDETLPLASSRAWSLEDQQVDECFIRGLFE